MVEYELMKVRCERDKVNQSNKDLCKREALISMGIYAEVIHAVGKERFAVTRFPRRSIRANAIQPSAGRRAHGAADIAHLRPDKG